MVGNSQGGLEERMEFVGPRKVRSKAGTSKQYKVEVGDGATVEVVGRQAGGKILLYS